MKIKLDKFGLKKFLFFSTSDTPIWFYSHLDKKSLLRLKFRGKI